ncbi:hypothetical protein OZL92_06845 [Bacillus sonorensis]|uniref:Lipoprotein n=2 Tax=Bacillus sonorensis TaxID=119858 RepID=A0ABM6LCC9_9BACI|nr:MULTISPECIES: hypothetical protein [Bacillus]TWK83469.1 hypothetical protein CHCC20335_4540 [Bacillus paralicheniformis]ASB86797.1 hypothetical protein S101395_00242 [Bacillus sonorensis]MBG9914664.1 hypothetical protein [Bacillus sonorensis]MCZ0072481.1 hypothetical protein [Bacillus sonorensis]MCZ0091102.1 hypothetical protein [Bacillus sonorensis]
MNQVLYRYPLVMIVLILIGFFSCNANPRFKKPLIVMCFAANGIYIIWRLGFTLQAPGLMMR